MTDQIFTIQEIEQGSRLLRSLSQIPATPVDAVYVAGPQAECTFLVRGQDLQLQIFHLGHYDGLFRNELDGTPWTETDAQRLYAQLQAFFGADPEMVSVAYIHEVNGWDCTVEKAATLGSPSKERIQDHVSKITVTFPTMESFRSSRKH